jgi:hypothetical protein
MNGPYHAHVIQWRAQLAAVRCAPVPDRGLLFE